MSIAVPVSEVFGWTTTQDLDGGDLSKIEPGSYRLRLSELDRDAANKRARTQAEPATDALIELWLHEPEPDRIIRATSVSARAMHDATGVSSREDDGGPDLP